MWDVHAAIAEKTRIGHGGLYYLVLGESDPTAFERVAWLKRPRGIRYQAPLEALAGRVQGPVSVWRKQMVLGPGHEFCLLGEGRFEIELPEGWEVLYVDRMLLHPARAR